MPAQIGAKNFSNLLHNFYFYSILCIKSNMVKKLCCIFCDIDLKKMPYDIKTCSGCIFLKYMIELQGYRQRKVFERGHSLEDRGSFTGKEYRCRESGF